METNVYNNTSNINMPSNGDNGQREHSFQCKNLYLSWIDDPGADSFIPVFVMQSMDCPAYIGPMSRSLMNSGSVRSDLCKVSGAARAVVDILILTECADLPRIG